jgi:hypothetical protein
MGLEGTAMTTYPPQNPTSTNIRAKAHELRARIERGEVLGSIEDALPYCYPLEQALRVFDGGFLEADDGLIRPTCCGRETRTKGGLFTGEAQCRVCGARIVDVLAPLSSPLLQRGNSYVSCAGEKMVDLFGERHWMVVHEGNRPIEVSL